MYIHLGTIHLGTVCVSLCDKIIFCAVYFIQIMLDVKPVELNL